MMKHCEKKADRRPAGPGWTKEEQKLLRSLSSPAKVQDFLDKTEYSSDPFYRAPRRVMRDRLAHCVDGALFAAAALRELGYPPLIMEMTAVRDDDHLLALYRRHGCWGAVAKSNFAGLRFREPVYRTPRELVLSYFELYFNVAGEKTLRAYSASLDLSKYDSLHWLVDDAAVETIIGGLVRVRHYPIISERQIENLTKVDSRSYQAGLLGSKATGLFQP